MKKSIILFLSIICISIACKKESSRFSRFDIRFANLEDTIYYDSVAYAIINYSEFSEFKDTSDYKNPDVFSHTVKVEKQSGSGKSITEYGLTLTAEHSYVLKKFDLVSKSGNIIFYVPYGALYYIVNGIKYPSFGLPYSFQAFDGSRSAFYVTKK